MDGLTPRIKIDSPGRRRAWARAIARTSAKGRFGVTRRRGPLEMALLRRTRAAFWMAQRNIFSQHLMLTAISTAMPRIQLAIHWSSPLSRLVRNNSTIDSRLTVVDGSVQPDRGTALFVAGRIRTTESEHHETRTLMRELLERTRRVEERVRVDKRLAARSAAPGNVPAEAQEQRRRTGPDWWKSEPAPMQQRAAAVPAPNVEQIADTVMRRLDARVSAWRERMGRI